jgi:hypothetical protein
MMSKTFDELMKVLEEKGEIPDDTAKKLIEEHGALSDEEKKQLAAAIKMKKALTKDKDEEKDKADKKEEKGDEDKDKEKKDDDEVSMDDYLKALSVLDSDDASEDEKKKARQVKEKFESD